MNKVFLLVIAVSFMSVNGFCQEWPFIKAGVDAVSQSSKITQAVSRKSAKQAFNTARMLPLQFVGLPATGNNVPSFITLSPSQLQALNVTAPTAVVHAQPGLLGTIKDKEDVSDTPAEETLEWNGVITYRTKGPFLYRGVGVNLNDLRHILIYGMEIGRTNEKCIYCSQSPSYALKFAARYQNKGFPVVVKISENNIWPLKSKLDGDNAFEKCFLDIPAHLFADVLVWLKIGEETAWYKVVLDEENRMIFSRAPIYWEDLDPE